LKRLYSVLLSLLLLISLVACSQEKEKELSFKIHKNYSDKITGEFAIDFITFSNLAYEYNRVAFNSVEESQEEVDLINAMQTLQFKLQENHLQLNEIEKQIKFDIISGYVNHISNRVAVLKAGHQLALINQEIGITENNEYLEIEKELTQYKDDSEEFLIELQNYIVIEGI